MPTWAKVAVALSLGAAFTAACIVLGSSAQDLPRVEIRGM